VNSSRFIISAKKRRRVKKIYNSLKINRDYFWYYHVLSHDIGYCKLTDSEAELEYNELNKRVELIERLLRVEIKRKYCEVFK
jgi:hypothetical protein